jgi:hypothetical protein
MPTWLFADAGSASVVHGPVLPADSEIAELLDRSAGQPEQLAALAKTPIGERSLVRASS